MSALTRSPRSNNSAPYDAWCLLLRDAVKEVFSMMVGAEVSDPEQVDPPSVTEVPGMVGLAGELCGVLGVRCSKSCASKIASKIASKMLDVTVAEAAAHMSDAVGEICYMVAGNFKAKVSGLDDKCLLSVPTVINGRRLSGLFAGRGRSNRTAIPVRGGIGMDRTSDSELDFGWALRDSPRMLRS